MMQFKSGKFYDWHHGDGYFASVMGNGWHVLFAARAKWRFAFINVPAKPGYRRLYVGPFEVEVYRRAAHQPKGEKP